MLQSLIQIKKSPKFAGYHTLEVLYCTKDVIWQGDTRVVARWEERATSHLLLFLWGKKWSSTDILCWTLRCSNNSPCV